MLNNKKSLIAISVAIGLVSACGSSDDDKNEVSIADVKSNYVDMAYAAYSDSLTTAQNLKTAVDAFIAAPSEANLNTAKAAYKEARVPYQQSEIMRWDTAITLSAQLDSDGGLTSVDDWEGQVNAWPLDENHIDTIIAGSDTINIDLLLNQNGANDNEANVTTGVHAIEYMLWGADTNGTAAGAGTRPASDFDTSNCNDGLCQRRAEYLSAATDLLVNDLVAMKAEWSPSAETTTGNLANNFVNSDLALDYIIGSMHAMATDELAEARMNSGLSTGDPEEEHDCFSDLSHVAIYYNFQGVKNAFYGEYKSESGTSISGASIGDLINQLDSTTYKRIDSALVSIEEKMHDIYLLGEDSSNPIKFDQIIGQADGEEARELAQSAVLELVALGQNIEEAVQVLSLNPIDTSGGGDSD